MHRHALLAAVPYCSLSLNTKGVRLVLNTQNSMCLLSAVFVCTATLALANYAVNQIPRCQKPKLCAVQLSPRSPPAAPYSMCQCVFSVVMLLLLAVCLCKLLLRMRVYVCV
jgi:hypothetical protein